MQRHIESEFINKIYTSIPDGIRLSKGAIDTVKQAKQAGVNEGLLIGYISAAGVIASQENRSKVGPFGPAAEYFSRIKEAVIYQRGQQAFRAAGR